MSRRSRSNAERQVHDVSVGTSKVTIVTYAPVHKQPRKGQVAYCWHDGDDPNVDPAVLHKRQLSCRPKRRARRLAELRAQFDFVEVRDA